MKKTNSISPMLQALRGFIKSSGMTYEELAKKMGISSATIKRLLNGKIPITLDRVSGICDILQIDMYELSRVAKFGVRPQTMVLTLDQEKALAANDALFLVFYLAVLGVSFDGIHKEYKLTNEQVLKLALKLEALGILELHPRNKFKMKVYRKIRWNMDGPLHKKYMVEMAQDFAGDIYRSHDSFKFFFNCPMSPESKEVVMIKIKELCREIEHISEMDLNLSNRMESRTTFFIGAKSWMPEVQRKFLR